MAASARVTKRCMTRAPIRPHSEGVDENQKVKPSHRLGSGDVCDGQFTPETAVKVGEKSSFSNGIKQSSLWQRVDNFG